MILVGFPSVVVLSSSGLDSGEIARRRQSLRPGSREESGGFSLSEGKRPVDKTQTGEQFEKIRSISETKVPKQERYAG